MVQCIWRTIAKNVLISFESQRIQSIIVELLFFCGNIPFMTNTSVTNVLGYGHGQWTMDNGHEQTQIVDNKDEQRMKINDSAKKKTTTKKSISSIKLIDVIAME